MIGAFRQMPRAAKLKTEVLTRLIKSVNPQVNVKRFDVKWQESAIPCAHATLSLDASMASARAMSLRRIAADS